MFAFSVLLVLSFCILRLSGFCYPSPGKDPGAGYFSILLLALAVWSGCYAAELVSTQLEWMVFWASCAYFGILLIPLTWLAFTLPYTGGRQFSPGGSCSCSPLCRCLFWRWCGATRARLIYRQIELVSTRLGTAAVYTHGPVFWVYTAYSYILLLTGSILLIRSLLVNRNPFRGQVFALLVAILAPWIGNLLYLSGYNPIPQLDLTPLAFFVTGGAVSFALFHYRFLDIVPVAQAHLIANLQDGLIVLDNRQRVVEINPAAEAIFSLTANAVIGREAAQVDWGCESLLPFMLSNAEVTAEVPWGRGSKANL